MLQDSSYAHDEETSSLIVTKNALNYFILLIQNKEQGISVKNKKKTHNSKE